MTSDGVSERFWSKVAMRRPDECWEWTACRNHRGYGLFRPTRKRGHAASRIAWELTNGPIPEGQCVLHRCDNPPCCNPSHLFVGTTAENAADCISKCRQALGVKNGSAKLDEFQVIGIAARYLQGALQREIACEYGVDQKTVSNIVNGKNWDHLFQWEGD